MLLAVHQPDLFYAREQMALSLGWHIVIACLGIGFPALVLLAEWRWLRTQRREYLLLARRWSRAMAVLFAVGAVSGTILSFEFGILWPRWMGRWGDVMGLPFTLEAIAFFIEAIFIGIYLYSWKRVSTRAHLLIGLPIPIAGVASAFFVVAANSWMNTPAGFQLGANGKPVNINPWAALFNSGLWPESTHMIFAAFIVSGSLVSMVYARALLRGKATAYHRTGFALAFSMMAICAPIQIVVGDWSARYIAHKQPTKLAAAEGLYKTRTGAPDCVGGYYSDNRLHGAICIKDGLSLLAFHRFHAQVQGLEKVPPADRPPVNVVRYAFEAMVGIGTAMLGLAIWFGWSMWRRRAIPKWRLFMWLALLCGPASVVALESGWVTTEVGRQPWIVYNVMRVRDAVTDAPGIRYGYYALLVVYTLLTWGTIVVLRRLAHEPLPAEFAETTT